jgi:tetratricopeptide (TPR) repeat protein
MANLRRSLRHTLVMIVAILAWLSVSDAYAGSRWAIVVGIDRYRSNDIPPLVGAVNDAQAMAEAFKRYVEVPESNVFVFTNEEARTAAIVQKLGDIRDQIRKSGQPDDLVLFFFAGHGVETVDGHYLMTYETQVRDDAGRLADGAITTTSLDAKRVTSMIESINVRDRVIMIDSCRTNPLLGKQAEAGDAYQTQFVLVGNSGSRATYLSTRQGYNAFESKARARGFFSFFVEEGLKGAAASRTGVTLSSLDNYLNENVPFAVYNETRERQLPTASLNEGSRVLVRPELMTTTPAQAQLELSRARSINGMVMNAGNQLLSNAIVTVRQRSAASRDLKLGGPPVDPGQGLVAKTDEHGLFHFDGLPPDVDYEIHVELAGHQPRTIDASPKEKVIFPVMLARDGDTLTNMALSAPPASSAPPPVSTPPGTNSPTRPNPPPSPSRPGAGSSRGIDLASLVTREHASVALESFLVEEFTVAAEEARQALSFDPDNALAHAVLANVLASEVTRNEEVARNKSRRTALLRESREHSDRALALNPDLALAHNARGLMLFAERRFDNAQIEFIAATKLDASLSVAHANLASVYVERKKWSDAEKSFGRAIELRPDNAIPYNGLSVVLREQQRYAEATKAARDAIARYDRRDTQLGDFYVNLAVIHFEDDKPDEAMNAVANAKRLRSKNHTALKRIEKNQGRRGP